MKLPLGRDSSVNMAPYPRLVRLVRMLRIAKFIQLLHKYEDHVKIQGVIQGGFTARLSPRGP